MDELDNQELSNCFIQKVINHKSEADFVLSLQKFNSKITMAEVIKVKCQELLLISFSSSIKGEFKLEFDRVKVPIRR